MKHRFFFFFFTHRNITNTNPPNCEVVMKAEGCIRFSQVESGGGKTSRTVTVN